MDAATWFAENEQKLKDTVAGTIRLELDLDFTQPDRTVEVKPEQAKQLANSIIGVLHASAKE